MTDLARVTYDEPADVLYITYTDAPAHHSVTRDGKVFRYDIGNRLLGITIVDFAETMMESAAPDHSANKEQGNG